MSSLVAQVRSQSGIRNDICSPHCRSHTPSIGLSKVLLVQLAILLKELSQHLACDCASHPMYESNMPYIQSDRSTPYNRQICDVLDPEKENICQPS